MSEKCRFENQCRKALEKYKTRIPLPASMILHPEIKQNCPEYMKKMVMELENTPEK